MPTVKSFLRSYSAAIRRAENEQRRQARVKAKRYQALLKEKELLDARQAVESYNDYIELLLSFHHDCSPGVDWKDIRNSDAPEIPVKNISHEAEIQNKINNYRPTFFDKILGRGNKKFEDLNRALINARKLDEDEYKNELLNYHESLAEWNEFNSIAKRLLDGDLKTCIEVINKFDPFSNLGELGTEIVLKIENNYLDIDIMIRESEIIPNNVLKLTSTGKLSQKKITKSHFNELYQDHVCSALLRIAREAFAYLPVFEIRVNAIGRLLNSSTGHMELQPIVSAFIVSDTLANLNLKRIDPSDSLANFKYNMKFSKLKGFSAVEKVIVN